MNIQYLNKPEWVFFHPSAWHKQHWDVMLKDYKNLQSAYPEFLQVYSAKEYNALGKNKVNAPVIGILVCEKPLKDGLDIINKGLNQSNKSIVTDAYTAIDPALMVNVDNSIRLYCNISNSSERNNCQGAMYMSNFVGLFKQYILTRIQQYNMGMFNKDFSLFDPMINTTLTTKNIKNPLFKQTNNSSTSNATALQTWNVQTPTQAVNEAKEKNNKKTIIIISSIIVAIIAFFTYKKFSKK